MGCSFPWFCQYYNTENINKSLNETTWQSGAFFGDQLKGNRILDRMDSYGKPRIEKGMFQNAFLGISLE
jgi:hypothetical protein